MQKFHARSPMLQAALLPVPAIRTSLLTSIDNDSSVVLIAEDDGGLVVGMMQAERDSTYADAAVIGMNIVTERARSAGVGTTMLRSLLGWGAERGYRHCTAAWTSSNLVSDAFYRSRGFTPVRYRLHRRVDSRVSWANEALDYNLFPAQ